MFFRKPKVQMCAVCGKPIEPKAQRFVDEKSRDEGRAPHTPGLPEALTVRIPNFEFIWPAALAPRRRRATHAQRAAARPARGSRESLATESPAAALAA